MLQRLRKWLGGVGLGAFVAVMLMSVYAWATTITWSHTFSDGEVLTAAMLETMKSDITSVVNAGGGPVTLTGSQTISGDKTFSGTLTYSGTLTASGTLSSTGTFSATGATITLGNDPTDALNINALVTAPIGIQGSSKNLVAIRDSATQVTVTADQLVVCNTSSVCVRLASVNETAAITGSGANGLDTGAEGGNTWYFVYIIRKSSDGTTDSLLSASASSPTMPSGYDQKALVTAVRNDGSSNFINFYQLGTTYTYDEYQSVLSTNSPASSFTDIDCSAVIPSITRLGRFNARELVNNGGSTATTFYFRPNGSAGAGTYVFEMSDGHGSGGQEFGASFELVTDASGVIEYKSETQQLGIKLGVVGFDLY